MKERPTCSWRQCRWCKTMSI